MYYRPESGHGLPHNPFILTLSSRRLLDLVSNLAA